MSDTATNVIPFEPAPPAAPEAPETELQSAPVTPDIQWDAELVGLVDDLPQVMQDWIQREVQPLGSAFDVVNSLAGRFVIKPGTEMSMLLHGFAIGTFVQMVGSSEELLDKPALAKDLTLHSTYSFLLTLLQNYRDEVEAQAAQDEGEAQRETPTDVN